MPLTTHARGNERTNERTPRGEGPRTPIEGGSGVRPYSRPIYAIRSQNNTKRHDTKHTRDGPKTSLCTTSRAKSSSTARSRARGRRAPTFRARARARRRTATREATARAVMMSVASRRRREGVGDDGGGVNGWERARGREAAAVVDASNGGEVDDTRETVDARGEAAARRTTTTGERTRGGGGGRGGVRASTSTSMGGRGEGEDGRGRRGERRRERGSTSRRSRMEATTTTTTTTTTCEVREGVVKEGMVFMDDDGRGRVVEDGRGVDDGC